MFTGLIEEVGAISRISGHDLTIMAERILDDLKPGDSVAVDGVCLTVVAVTENSFVVQTSPETLDRTTLGRSQVGEAVNIERAMTAGGRFGGHFVLGHVDGVGHVAAIRPQGDFALWRFQAPAEVSRYLVPKGSVAIDGISLTVVEPKGGMFSVAIIPATLAMTTLNGRGIGDAVNIEADVIGKHVYHYLKGVSSSGITQEMLHRYGFA